MLTALRSEGNKVVLLTCHDDIVTSWTVPPSARFQSHQIMAQGTNPARTDDVSLVVLLLEVNPYVWGKQGTSTVFPFQTLLEQVRCRSATSGILF